jgi:hypothetical protein
VAGLLALMQTRRSRDGVIGVCVLGCGLDDRRIVVQFLLIPVTGRSKARVYGRSLAGIAGSNPVCCTLKTKEQARTIKTKKQVWKKYKERIREGIEHSVTCT